MANDSALLRCKTCNALNRVPAKRLSQNPICGKCKALLDFPFQVMNATAASFDQELASWFETALVVFWDKESALFKTIDPTVADLAFARAGKLKVLKVDVDAEPGLALLFSVQASPTFIVFQNSRQLGRMDGTPRESAELTQWVERFFS
ncbi:MAG: thioredoxin domain-containing protein [Nitrospirota bacterium]